jgi:hypothetical protein
MMNERRVESNRIESNRIESNESNYSTYIRIHSQVSKIALLKIITPMPLGTSTVCTSTGYLAGDKGCR